MIRLLAVFALVALARSRAMAQEGSDECARSMVVIDSEWEAESTRRAERLLRDARVWNQSVVARLRLSSTLRLRSLPANDPRRASTREAIDALDTAAHMAARDPRIWETFAATVERRAREILAPIGTGASSPPVDFESARESLVAHRGWLAARAVADALPSGPLRALSSLEFATDRDTEDLGERTRSILERCAMSPAEDVPIVSEARSLEGEVACSIEAGVPADVEVPPTSIVTHGGLTVSIDASSLVGRSATNPEGWTRFLGDEVTAVVGDGSTTVALTSLGTMVAFDPEGDVVWAFASARMATARIGIVAGTIVVARGDGAVLGVDAHSGRERFRTRFEGDPIAVVATDRFAYVVAHLGGVARIDVQRGTSSVVRRGQATPFAVASVGGVLVLALGEPDRVVAIDDDGGAETIVCTSQERFLGSARTGDGRFILRTAAHTIIVAPLGRGPR